MASILICPGERPAVGFLSQAVPLVAIPMLGETLLGYWLEHLARAGEKRVLVLATDRPEMVRAVVGNGSRWGLQIEVRAELKEFTPAEAGALQPPTRGSLPATIATLDHLPGRADQPVFRSYREWFYSVLGMVPRASQMDRIGLHQHEPGVWCGSRVQIAPTAQLRPPCWLGNQVRIGPDATIGPDAILENRVVVEAASEVQSSLVGPDTFVGRLVKVEGSIAWGSTLIDWKTGSCTQVPDSFLLSSLGPRYLPSVQRSPLRGWRSLWARLRGSGRAFFIAE